MGENHKAIDNARARGLEVSSGVKLHEAMVSPILYFSIVHTQRIVLCLQDYSVLFADYHVFVFLLSVLLFHFSNAAMLPLLSQEMFLGNAERGFEFAALAVIIAQVSMICSASTAGYFVARVGTKPLFLIAVSAIPIRGCMIVLLLTYLPDNTSLLATQILDGVAGGIMGVLTVLISEHLAR